MTGMEGRTALVVIDMLNTYEHADAEKLTESVAGVVEPISELIARAVEEQAPVIYVNDNYGDWNSRQEELTERALEGARPDLVEPILPPREVDFVIKARHTIFYMTPLKYCSGSGGSGGSS
jgi:nicotinamidase-related amidase